jgi:hypothetical protein
MENRYYATQWWAICPGKRSLCDFTVCLDANGDHALAVFAFVSGNVRYPFGVAKMAATQKAVVSFFQADNVKHFRWNTKRATQRLSGWAALYRINIRYARRKGFLHYFLCHIVSLLACFKVNPVYEL